MPGTSSVSAVHVTAGQTGLSALNSRSVDLLADGSLSAQTVILKSSDGISTQGSTTPSSASYDPATHRLTQNYPWGMIRCKYAPSGNRLNMTVAVTNSSSSESIQAITLQLMAIKFPNTPKGWVPNYVYIGSNTGDPTIITADYGSGEISVCNDDVTGTPLLVGFPGRADFSSRPIVISTAKGWVLSPYLDKYINRPIAPGATDIYHVSVRFNASGSSEKTVAGDLISKFVAAYPQTLNWPDHRAIGSLHLAVTEPTYHSAGNPRGWFMDPTGVNITTAAGRVAFKARVMKYADDSINVLKQNNAQGMVVWDIEGEEHPQATTYIGDPRLLKRLDPEMDPIADEFFAKYLKAGIRTGLCIRPQQLEFNSDGSASQLEIDGDSQIVQLLTSKMVYANKRWGCTLFYVDSNGDPNVPYSASIFKRTLANLSAKGIKALIMPEHQNTLYYAYTAPYDELRMGVTETPAAIRNVYPKAFTVLYVPDGPVDQDKSLLVHGVRHGDVLMFRGWWPDSFNSKVSAIYKQARS